MDKHLDPEAIGDYAEGLMDGSRRAAADAHLADCAECRQSLAVAQAYFRELEGLEPVPAPADFLAKVRARLPQPTSPWRRLWSDLSAAMRAVPMPIAVAVILGVTAITVYLKQGGSDDRPPALAPAMATTREAVPLSGSAPTAPEAPPPTVASKPHPLAQAPLRLTAPGFNIAPPDPSRLKAGRPAGSFRIAGRRSNIDPFEAAPDRKPEPPPAPRAAPSGVAANGSGDALASADQEETRIPSGEAAGAAPARSEAHSVPAAPRAKASAAKSRTVAADRDDAALPTEYVLSLRNPGDSGVVLSGLKAMGIRCEPGPDGKGENRFLLTVPAPMLGELGPYLSRYGTAVLQGPPPSPSADSVAVRLRVRLPTR
jgi:hypothetical protein